MKVLRAGTLMLLVIALSGCITFFTELHVAPDGSGTLDGGVLPIPATSPALAGGVADGPEVVAATIPSPSPMRSASTARPATAARFIARRPDGDASGGPSIEVTARVARTGPKARDVAERRWRT